MACGNGSEVGATAEPSAQASVTPEPSAADSPPTAPHSTVEEEAQQAGVAAAAVADQRKPASTGRLLRGVPEIRAFFRTNTSPVYFFGPTAFNLLGIDRWVRNFDYVVYYDSWDGSSSARVHAARTSPTSRLRAARRSTTICCATPRCASGSPAAPAAGNARPKVAMVFFDEETEQICEELGYDLILPSDQLRRHLDSKIVTTRLGNEAGAPSVPNVLSEGVDSWDAVAAVATEAGLGTDLVLQTPYGDSGKTTFFLRGEDDWDRCKDEIVGKQVKIMKRINNRAVAVEAVITRHGTVVGPFMTDLTGYPELTPYEGGWCGNDLFPEALTDEHRGSGRSRSSSGSAIDSARRATSASSRSTCCSTLTPARCTSASSTPGSPARPRCRT